MTVRNKEGNPQNTSETLVTKVMLGTTGCIPAFDNYVEAAMKDIDGLSYSLKASKRRSTIKSLWKYYFGNIHEFEAVSEMLRTEGHPDYPPMKLLDMYLWKRGEMLKRKAVSP